MTRYKITLHYSDGTEEEPDEEFASLDDAVNYGNDMLGCCTEGAAILNFSNTEYSTSENYGSQWIGVIELKNWTE